MSEDEHFLRTVVEMLVDLPEEIVIVRTVDEGGVLLKMSVAPDDFGMVIGKQGVTANALRTLLRAVGAKSNARCSLKIIDGDQL